MLDAGIGPGGEDDKDLGAGAGGGAEGFGKTQVVADERGHAQAGPIKRRHAASALVHGVLAGAGEGELFAIAGEFEAVGPIARASFTPWLAPRRCGLGRRGG